MVTSIKNGAAMRAYPIGVFDDALDVMEYAGIQAELTHNTMEGILSSEAVALMSHYTLYNKGRLKHIHQYLEDIQGINWDNNWGWEIECDGMQTVDAIVTLINSSPEKMSDILLDSVNFGGDVDTVASVALAIASNSDEVENDLPKILYKDIEKGRFGIDYIKKIDRKLMEKRCNFSL
jgi:ADP-ribosylglycohydrolase